jgi:hypothetical protein
MKKLLLVLQVVGLVAICPVYVALEMTHTIKNEKISTLVSEDAKNIQISHLEFSTK